MSTAGRASYQNLEKGNLPHHRCTWAPVLGMWFIITNCVDTIPSPYIHTTTANRKCASLYSEFTCTCFHPVNSKIMILDPSNIAFSAVIFSWKSDTNHFLYMGRTVGLTSPGPCHTSFPLHLSPPTGGAVPICKLNAGKASYQNPLKWNLPYQTCTWALSWDCDSSFNCDKTISNPEATFIQPLQTENWPRFSANLQN